MTRIGIDIEQFVRDTYGSGIQRVLQYLAKDWPTELVDADFVVPVGERLGVLTPLQAADLLSIPFEARDPGSDLRSLVRDRLEQFDPPTIDVSHLTSYDAWLLPEVSYLPAVLARFEFLAKGMPTAMIGYDTLPMSEPANYRFKPGTAASVSEYFRHLAAADAVVCISEYARDTILGRLRRDPGRAISVAHPGGDHLEIREGLPPDRARFTRLGTMESRKRPMQILSAFLEATLEHGTDAELVFIGSPSASDESINVALLDAIRDGHSVTWVRGASDAEVLDLLNQSSAFLSIGTEGYGIPVLEAIRVGAPVLYDGVQPAADVMSGRGARRVPAMGHEELVRMFVDFSRPGRLGQVRSEVDGASVPTWSAFVRQVAAAVS